MEQNFRKRILEFIRPRPNSTFNVPNSLGLTSLTRLRVGLKYLREHKCRLNFPDSLNSICDCGNATGIIHLLQSQNFLKN